MCDTVYSTLPMINDSQEIKDLSSQLAQAVEAALNPQVDQEIRHKANKVCEEFKEKSPQSIQCSIYLSIHGSHLVRHFGLQLMEYCIKYKWYEIDQMRKLSIKDIAMSLLQSPEGDVAQHVHLRDAVSRVIVEMMKREWPQHWPNLLPELFQIAADGCVQAEIVLLILLRFIEDVVVLQTLEYPTRRRDLYQHLVLQLDHVFSFIIELIGHHYKLNIFESVRVINLSLKLLSEIVEFAMVTRITAEEICLLPALCNLFVDERFQLETAECLNRLATKKGKHEDRRTICKLYFNSTLLDNISQVIINLPSAKLNEYNYLFIKKASELLASLTTLLCLVVKSDDDNIYGYMKPESFVKFLEILVNLCHHPSLVISFNVNTCWTSLFKHNILNKNTTLLDYTSKWIIAVMPRFVKFPYNPHVTQFEDCYRYLVFDFDSEQTFIAFYQRLRVDLSDACKYLGKISPQVAFSFIEHWLRTTISKNTLLLDLIYSPISVEYLEWEAISSFIEVILCGIPEDVDIHFERCAVLLDACFNLKPTDPNIRSFILSCISPLMYFVDKAPNDVASIYVTQLLERIFYDSTYKFTNDTRFNLSKHEKGLHRHAACLLLKLSHKYPTMFVLYFDRINTTLNSIRSQLSRMEQIVFTEVVIQISNSSADYKRQGIFIKHIFHEVEDYWFKLVDVFCDYSKFSSFIGLAVKPSDYWLTYKNRCDLMYCIDLIMVIVKSSTWPESKELAIKGGFIKMTTNEQPAYRNPASPHILPALPGVFSLIKAIHFLWTGEARSKLCVEYKQVHDISKIEVQQLGAHVQKPEVNVYDDVSSDTENVQWMRSFLVNLYENCFAVLAKSCQNIGYEFYKFPNFASSFEWAVFCNLDSVPDYRLRAMIRTFFKPFILNCPANKYDELMIPILNKFTTYMHGRLTNRWAYLNECRENGRYNEDESEEDNKELMEHYIITHLSREYMDAIKAMILRNSGTDSKSGDIGGSNDELPFTVGSQNNLHTASNMYDTLSDLGIRLLRDETSRLSILHFIVSAIPWTDSTNSLKATFKIPAIVKQLLNDGNMTTDLSVHIVERLLQGLIVHGQHDANQGALLNAVVLCYQIFRPLYPQLLEEMKKLPNINVDDLLKFDQKMLQVTVPYKVDKGMRDMFKKLVNNLIGQNIGQLFKRKEAIRDLPKVEVPRYKNESILNISSNENEVGIANFFK